MKKRIMMSLMIIGLVSALVGGATFAIFTDSATNAANTFTAGTIDVGATAQTYALEAATGNMAPGDEIDGSFVISNSGSLDLRYKVYTVVDGELFGGENPATVSITSENDEGDIVASGEDITISYSVELPLGADNSYQEAEGTLQFVVLTEQTDNNGIEITTLPETLEGINVLDWARPESE